MEKEANLNPQTEALINTFCEITSSSSKSQALFFLESHNFDLDSAVSTFLENSSLPSAASPAVAADPVSPSDSQSYSPSQSESSSPSRSRSPSPPPSLTSNRKRKPSSIAYNLRSSRPRNSAAVAASDVAVGVGRRSRNRRPTTGSGSDSDEPQEFDTGGEKSGKLVQDPSKKNDMDALFNQARQYAAVEGPSEHLSSSGSRSFTGAARRLTGEVVPSVPLPPENVTHAFTCWRNGFTVDDGPPRNFDDPENASFLEDGALPLQDAALNVNVPLNLVGPIGVADPARNLVAERDQEAQRDRAVAIARCSRFEARSCLAPPFRGLADPNIETAILAPASNFPSERITYPKESTFIPCFISVLYYLNQMDHIMVSTKRWTDNCMGWVPPYSQIYISVLLYIQVIRAMDSAGIFRAGSRLSIFLRELETLFPFTNLWIPGPLVSAFKNLSCFWPSATGMFGSVSPSLPATPEWTQADRFSFGNRFASHLPNISIFISRLHSICSVATRPAVTEHLFSNDVDGPRFMATLFSQACVHDENELINVASPGASSTYSGGLRLWQNAAAHLYFYDLPSPLDISVDHVENDWISALRMNNRSSWLGPLAAMMAKYCQFWKSSCSLADCSPNCSATGSVRCVATGGTNVFQGPVWTNETGSRNNFQHGNANQVGHYTMRPSLHLMFKASTTIHDIPDAHVYPATTFHFNLSPNDAGLTVLNEGPFWDVHPPAYQMSGIQVYQGVTLTIARDYHSDTQIDSKHQ